MFWYNNMNEPVKILETKKNDWTAFVKWKKGAKLNETITNEKNIIEKPNLLFQLENQTVV